MVKYRKKFFYHRQEADADTKSEPNQKYLNEQMEMLERIKSLGKNKINYKKEKKQKSKTSKNIVKPTPRAKPVKPTPEQDQLASILAMELSSLLFYFN